MIDCFIEAILAERNSSYNTVLSYKRDLLDFKSFAKPLLLQNADQSIVLSYIGYLNNKKLSTSTIRRKLIALRQFYGFLYTEKIIKINPTIDIDLPKKTQKLPKYLEVEEIKKLFLSIKNSKDKNLSTLNVMLQMLYSSGMRVSELISLKINDIKPLLEGRDYIVITGKGKKERTIVFCKNAIHELKQYISLHAFDSAWLFPSKICKNSVKDSHITRQGFALMLKRAAIFAGIAPERISPHVIRHSFATHLLNNGMDIKIIQDLLGHSSIATTQIYTHLGCNALHQEVLKKHPLSSQKVNR